MTLLLCLLLSLPLFAQPKLLSVTKIWDQGNHNAFTDLIRFKGAWYCSFREADDHVGGDGRIRILTSRDGARWTSAAALTEAGIDLRDPKLSIAADNRLMVVAGGSVYQGTKVLKGRQPRVAFSKDGRNWTAPRRVLNEGEWLWRVAWHQGKAYGVAYNSAATSDWAVTLYESADGLDWTAVTPLEVPGRPNETTVRFLPNGDMVALVRREAQDKQAWIGLSHKPYKTWTWHPAGHQVGGPNFIVLANGQMIGGGRDYRNGPPNHTAIGPLTADSYSPQLTLPSSGDNSYPGFVFYKGMLWTSYYSTHEGKTAIYLAKIRLP